MIARWNGEVLAESNATVVVESNHYFPADSIKQAFFIPSNTRSHCPWKGDAAYYTLVVNGKENKDAAWYYPQPKPAATNIKNRIAFWRGVTVTET